MTAVATGDRVGIAWHGGHDGSCDACLEGDFIHCKNERITGFSFDGGYGQYMLAPEVALARVPDGMSFTDAMNFASQHGIRPMTESFPLDDAGKAYDRMMSGDVRFRAVIDLAR